MRHSCVFVLCLFANCPCIQANVNESSSKIDSLQVVLSNSPDTQKVTICNALFQEYKSVDLDRALNYASEALRLSRRINDQRRIAESYFQLSTAHLIRQENEKASEYIQQALRIFKKINNTKWISKCLFNSAMLYKNKSEYSEAIRIYRLLLEEKSKRKDTVFMIAVLNNMGNAYSEKGEFDSSQVCYYHALEIYTKNNDLNGVAHILSAIASLNNQMGEYKQAIANAKKSLDAMRLINNKEGIALDLYTIGRAYYEIKNQYDSSQYYLTNALKIYQEMGDMQSIMDSKFMLGNLFFEKKDYLKAKKYYSEALEESRDSEDLLRKGYAFFVLAHIQFNQEHNYHQAKIHADSSMAIFQKIDSKYYLLQLYKLLAEISAKIGSYQKAYDYLALGMSLNDSVFKQEKIKLIIELDKKYETEKKQQDITRLSQQNQIQELDLKRKKWQLYGLTGGLLVLSLLVCIGLLFLRQRKLLADRKRLELEQRLLRSQMNPHFIFNAMGSIQNFILENNRKEATVYLARFAKLMRLVLENSRESFIPLSKEMLMLEHYLELQRLVVNRPFDYNIEIDPAIDPEKTEIPPMLSQPFIENAIKHGLTHPQDKGHIFVR
ncbi:MAG: tetratricopeptide repeat protein, partial [Bacteroidetes bacterium]